MATSPAPEKPKKSQSRYDESSIKALEGREAVRKRPAMYIGNTGSIGLHHLITEVIDNSIDEALAGRCDHITLVIHYDNSITATDNGVGIPVKNSPIPKYSHLSTVELVMTVLHAGGKFEKEAYKYSGGLHGVGVSVVNFLSEWMEVEVKRNGEIHLIRFERGKTVDPLHTIGATKKTGTKIRFRPDPEIFDDINFHYELIERRFRELAFLNPGLRMQIEDERTGKKNDFRYKGGIVEFLKNFNESRQTISQPIFFSKSKEFVNASRSGEKDTIIGEIALQYSDTFNENIFAYANNISNPDGGAHVSGFRSALTRTLNNYARKNDMLKKLKDSITGEDVREGLSAVISIKIPDPQFEGQTKGKLLNMEVDGLVQQIVNEGLSEYLEENPPAARKIITKIIRAAEARIAARKAREIVRKSAMEITALPGKLTDCTDKDPDNTELFIVEGDSAGGPARQGRDRHFQAVLPIKGKILNTERARLDKVLSNEEIRTMVTALGTGIGKDNFNIEKLRYGKVIIMTDADVDGAHIRTLLLTFFYRQMEDLIRSNKIYIALPPLYRVTQGRKTSYIETDEEKDRYLMNLGAEAVQFTVNHQNKPRELNRAQIRQLIEALHAIENLARTIQRRGITLKELIDHRKDKSGKLPEFMMIKDGDKSFAYSEEELAEWESRFSDDIEESNGEDTQLELGIDEDVPQDFKENGRRKTYEVYELAESHDLEKNIAAIEKLGISIDDYFEKSVAEQTIDDEDALFIITGKNDEYREFSLIDAFERIKKIGSKGLSIQRYKGLGEMNHDQLWETTMNPATRMLRQVTLEDAISCEVTFRTLMGDQVQPRRAFIQAHAPEVRNLDI